MDKTGAAGLRRCALGEPGLVCSPDPSVLSSPHSLHFPSSSYNPSPHVSIDQFEAFEAAVNGGDQQVCYSSHRINEATAPIELSCKSSDADRIFSHPGGAVDQMTESANPVILNVVKARQCQRPWKLTQLKETVFKRGS